MITLAGIRPGIVRQNRRAVILQRDQAAGRERRRSGFRLQREAVDHDRLRGSGAARILCGAPCMAMIIADVKVNWARHCWASITPPG